MGDRFPVRSSCIVLCFVLSRYFLNSHINQAFSTLTEK